MMVEKHLLVILEKILEFTWEVTLIILKLILLMLVNILGLKLKVIRAILGKKVIMPKTSQSHLHLNTSNLQMVAKHLHQTQLQSDLLSKEKSVLVNGSTVLMVALALLML